MTLTLHVDASRGLSPAALLAALVDLGVAPSPVLHAVQDAGVDAELRFEPAPEGTLARAIPTDVRVPPVDAFLRATGLAPTELDVAARAFGGVRAAAAEDALLIAGVAFAWTRVGHARAGAGVINAGPDPSAELVELLGDVADALGFEDAPSVTPAGAALLRALVPDDALGLPEPAWVGAPQKGVGVDAQGRVVGVRVGEVP